MPPADVDERAARSSAGPRKGVRPGAASAPEFKLYYSNTRQAYFIRYKDAAGHWQAKAVPVDVQQEHQAHLWAMAWMEERQGAPRRPSPTFRHISELWLKRREDADDPKALSSAKTFASLWLGDLADVPVEKCGIGDASRWVEWVRSKCRSPYTARNIVAGMRGMVVEARGMGWVELRENVFADAWITKLMGVVRPPGAAIVRLEKAQLLRLLTCADVPRKRRLRYAVAASTALRLGELAALRRSDVRDAVVDVQRQLTYGRTKPPKKGSVRLVPLHPLLAESLEVSVAPSSPVLDVRGHGNWSRELREDLAVAGMSPRHRSGANFTFHAMRRTGLTVMRASGMPMEDVKAVAGHSGRSVTERHYASEDLEMLRKGVVGAFDDLLRAWHELHTREGR